MKKMIMITGLILAAMQLTGCTSTQAKMSHIDRESAKAVALKDAGFSVKEVKFTEADLEERNGQAYYDIDFTANGQKYEYDIDALTGVILEYQGPPVQGAQEKTAEIEMGSTSVRESEVTMTETEVMTSVNMENTGATETVNETDAVVSAKTEPGQVSEPGAQDGYIGDEKAKELAMAHAELTSEQVTFVKCGLDWDDGRRIYDVEFYSDTSMEYDYDIDALTGEIRAFDHDAEYYKPATANTETPDGSITEAEAKALALAQVPGATENDIWEFEVDYDDGRIEYEGKIHYDAMEYEFEIDGYSGAIRKWDVESIYD